MAVSNTAKGTSSARRRWLFGTNVSVMIVLCGFVVIGLNWLGGKYSVRKDLTGGFGSIPGSAIGSALTGMLRTGLVLINVPSNTFRGAIGAIMIGAVVLNAFVRRDR